MGEIEVAGFPRHLLDRLLALWETGTHCDVKLCSKNGELMTHKLVLIAASPFLAGLLSDESSEGDDSAKMLNFDSVGHDVLRAVVGLMYTGKLSIKENIEDVKQFCETLQVTCAIEAIEDYMKNDSVVDEPSVVVEVKEINIVDSPHTNALKVKLRKSDIDKKIEEPVRKRRKITPRKERIEISTLTRRRGRKQATPKTKNTTKSARLVKRVIKEECSTEATEVDAEINETADKNLAGAPDAKTSGALEVKLEIGKPLDTETNKVAEDDNDYNSDTDNVDIDSDFEPKKTSTHKTLKTKSKTKPIAGTVKQGRKLKSKAKGKDTEDDSGEIKEEEKKGSKKRRKKEFPCGQCSRVLSSLKRKVFHEFSKHGAPVDTTKYQMVPCDVEVCCTKKGIHLYTLMS